MVYNDFFLVNMVYDFFWGQNMVYDINELHIDKQHSSGLGCQYEPLMGWAELSIN